jgi:hypothetical protein
VLGTFQDSEAQHDAIYAFAADMIAQAGTPVRTILAMGEMAAQLQQDQNVSRSRFADTFERFARRSRRHQWARLRRPDPAPTEAATAATAGPAR